jgi:hypothetical protein
MNILTLCYSNHRPETLAMVSALMQQHEAIFLEEPPHDCFQDMLRGNYAIDDLLLELDVEYPLFIHQYYQILQKMKVQGKDIMQLEPFLAYLLRIHFFFAEGHAPQELDQGTVLYDVYIAERNATGCLIAYYKASQADDFDRLLLAMQAFAKADAQRFKLRDTLRADAIVSALKKGCNTFVEAGTMHQYLQTELKKNIPPGWTLKVRWLENEIASGLELKGNMISPGDELTFAYIFNKTLNRAQENLLCARSLIYAKIIHKEEIDGGDQLFPHVHDEFKAIKTVNMLSFNDCRKIYNNISPLATHEAQEAVQRYLDRKC